MEYYIQTLNRQGLNEKLQGILKTGNKNLKINEIKGITLPINELILPVELYTQNAKLKARIIYNQQYPASYERENRIIELEVSGRQMDFLRTLINEKY